MFILVVKFKAGLKSGFIVTVNAISRFNLAGFYVLVTKIL